MSMSPSRQLGPFKVSPLGLGCMSMSHAYGKPDRTAAEECIHRALDCGYNFLDTAALYGFGHNESLVGEVLGPRRKDIVLASKCGLNRGPDGKRAVNGRPEKLRQTCDESLQRLQTEVIDLYYLHRRDPDVPIEESVGALGELVKAGKVRSIGLSEVNANTLRRAHGEFPIAALQSEYSLWTRNPEGEVLTACRELGVAFVPFSPLGRAFLTGKLLNIENLADSDLRRSMPRFQGENWQHNLSLLQPLQAMAKAKHCSMGQLALAWLLAQGEDIIPIPGTQHADYAEENAGAVGLELDAADLAQLNNMINADNVQGDRYNADTMAAMET